jgi:hypothetical protein
MDLVNAMSSLQQTQMAQAIQIRLASKVLDVQRQQGAAALQLLQQAASAGPGDPNVARATGLGGAIDCRG